MPSAVPTHGVPRPEARQQEHGDRAERGDAHLRDVEEMRSAAQPVEGDEEEVARCRMVAEHLKAADGHEAAEVRQQPDALVVDAHVEVDGREAVVLQVDEDREDHAQTTMAIPSTISGPRSASGVDSPDGRGASAATPRAGGSPVVVPMGLHARIAQVEPVDGLCAGSS